MRRGGRRPGAGRKPGVPAQKTIARRLIAEQAAAKGVTPLDVMLNNMRDAYAQGCRQSKPCRRKFSTSMRCRQRTPLTPCTPRSGE
jgi:hypothetical protein